MSDKPTDPAPPTPESQKTPLPENGRKFLSLGQLAAIITFVLGLLGAAWLRYWEKPPSISPREFTPELVVIQLNDTFDLAA